MICQLLQEMFFFRNILGSHDSMSIFKFYNIPLGLGMPSWSTLESSGVSLGPRSGMN